MWHFVCLCPSTLATHQGTLDFSAVAAAALMVNLLKDGLMKHRTRWELDMPWVPKGLKRKKRKIHCTQHRETWYDRRAKLNPLSGWMTFGVACRKHSSRPVLCVNFCVRNMEFGELKIELGQMWFQAYSSNRTLVIDIRLTLIFYDSRHFWRPWSVEVDKSPELWQESFPNLPRIFRCFDTKAISRPFVCAGEGFELCAMFAFRVTVG